MTHEALCLVHQYLVLVALGSFTSYEQFWEYIYIYIYTLGTQFKVFCDLPNNIDKLLSYLVIRSMSFLLNYHVFLLNMSSVSQRIGIRLVFKKILLTFLLLKYDYNFV